MFVGLPAFLLCVGAAASSAVPASPFAQESGVPKPPQTQDALWRFYEPEASQEPTDYETLLREKNELLEQVKMLEEANQNLLGERLLQRRRRRLHANGTNTNRESIDTLDVMPPPRGFRPTDCADLLVAGVTTSGVYEIYPFTCLCSKPLLVWCDMETEGGGWTVFMTRVSEGKREHFNRSWTEYRDGFGTASGEFWIGNEMLHTITHGRPYYLRMDVTMPDTSRRYALWPSIQVGNEVTRYALTLGTYMAESTTHSNCLNYASGKKFSTYDRDNDNTGNHCSVIKGGGWWFHTCSAFNPITMTHNCFTNVNIAPLSIQFKIRPSVCSSTMKTIYLNNYDCAVCH